MKRKPTRGGARKGAGRPATGKVVISKSISLTESQWNKLDALKGEQSRSAWIGRKIDRAKP